MAPQDELGRGAGGSAASKGRDDRGTQPRIWATRDLMASVRDGRGHRSSATGGERSAEAMDGDWGAERGGEVGERARGKAEGGEKPQRRRGAGCWRSKARDREVFRCGTGDLPLPPAFPSRTTPSARRVVLSHLSSGGGGFGTRAGSAHTGHHRYGDEPAVGGPGRQNRRSRTASARRARSPRRTSTMGSPSHRCST